MRLSKVEMMTTESKKFSVYADGISSYWVGETERIKTSVPRWVFPEITCKKLAVIVPLTREKLNDSVINVFREIQPIIAESFYKKIDQACLFGTGSPFAHSIYSAATGNSMAVQLGTNAKLDLDVSDVMSLIEVKGYDVNGFVSNVSFKNSLRKLRDNNGNQLFVEGITDRQGQRYDSLYAQPIEFCRSGAWDATKAICIGGNWNYSIIGVRENIEYEILKEATLNSITMPDGKPLSLAENDMVGIKATMRIGFLPVKDDAFAILTPAASAGAGSDTVSGGGGNLGG
jgi:HK97 family phage major capsid protein